MDERPPTKSTVEKLDERTDQISDLLRIIHKKKRLHPEQQAGSLKKELAETAQGVYKETYEKYVKMLEGIDDSASLDAVYTYLEGRLNAVETQADPLRPQDPSR